MGEVTNSIHSEQNAPTAFFFVSRPIFDFFTSEKVCANATALKYRKARIKIKFSDVSRTFSSFICKRWPPASNFVDYYSEAGFGEYLESCVPVSLAEDYKK